MKPRPTDNPHNRFHSQVVSYDDGCAPPPSQITVLEDQSRSILAHNDSPDGRAQNRRTEIEFRGIRVPAK